MLREVKGLHGAVLHARDGEIGSVDNILFDDKTWIVRYLVVNTGGWLNGRKVLIAPPALRMLDWEQHVLAVHLTRAQVENSPGLDTDEPVSRQWETDTYDYYGWPYYWGMGGIGMGMGGMGLGMIGGGWHSPGLIDSADTAATPDPGDVHLRSAKEVTGYTVAARDGDIGHVADFLVDDDNWRIRCLAVDTRDWWPGKQVLLPLDWIEQISWPDGTVAVEVTRSQIQNAPYWEPGKPFSPAFLGQLAGYHAKLGGQKEAEVRAEAGRAEALAGLR